MRGGLEKESQPLRLRLTKEAGGWAVLGSRGRLIYRDTCYAKAVGVFDFLTEWRFISRDFVSSTEADAE